MKNYFFSFLGTGDYREVNYKCPDGVVRTSRYIQEVLVDYLIDKFPIETLEVVLFLTTESREKHFNTKESSSLLKVFNDKKIPYREVEIVNPDNAKNVESLFENFLSQIPSEGNLILDITHSFRSIPILSLAALAVKRVCADNINSFVYYGELQGSSTNVIDLSKFVDILEWSKALQLSVHANQNELLLKLTRNELKPRLSEKEVDSDARRIRDLVNTINDFSIDLSTSRLKTFSDKAVSLKKTIENLDGVKYLPAIRDLVSNIYDKVKNFNGVLLNDAYYAAEWCIGSSLYPQAITIIQESIVSELCKKEGLPTFERRGRELISQVFQIASYDIPQDEWKSPSCDNVETVNRLKIYLRDRSDVFSLYSRISSVRNDINHAGTGETSGRGQDIVKNIRDIIDKFRLIKESFD